MSMRLAVLLMSIGLGGSALAMSSNAPISVVTNKAKLAASSGSASPRGADRLMRVSSDDFAAKLAASGGSGNKGKAQALLAASGGSGSHTSRALIAKADQQKSMKKPVKLAAAGGSGKSNPGSLVAI